MKPVKAGAGEQTVFMVGGGQQIGCVLQQTTLQRVRQQQLSRQWDGDGIEALRLPLLLLLPIFAKIFFIFFN